MEIGSIRMIMEFLLWYWQGKAQISVLQISAKAVGDVIYLDAAFLGKGNK